MFKNFHIRKHLMLITCLCALLLISACGVTLKHVPAKSLNAVSIQKHISIMVADIGDARENESFDRIGQGASYWLPVSFYARDEEENELPVSYYIAQSLSEDLTKIGYKTKMANDVTVRKSLTLDESIAIAKKEGVDYLVTTKLKEGKTNFWGFLIIPFFEPVWTRLVLDAQLINAKDEKNITPIQTDHRETEWYFAKITIGDAIFDAGLFGKHWHSTAWGETVISDGLAETALKLSEKIQSQENTVVSDASAGTTLKASQKVQ
ncbi:MAG: hypothetical protein PHG54_11350 [Smithellaceae bacterium]|nr:hypothetical protein [Smithellaceae bacterium]